MNKKSQQSSKNRSLTSYAKYSSMAIQMILILLLGAFGGKALDSFFQFKFPVFTLGLLLLALITVIYLIIRSVLK